MAESAVAAALATAPAGGGGGGSTTVTIGGGAGGGAEAGAATPGTAGTAGAGTPAATPASNEAWFGKMDAETQMWLKAGKFDTPDALEALPRIIAKARNAESLVGADKVALPKEGDADAYKATMLRLGASAAIDGYKVPEPLAKDVLALAFQKYAHENGMPVKYFDGAVKLVTDTATAQAAEQIATFEAQTKAETEATLAAWGAAKGQNLEAGKRFVREMKLDAKDADGVTLVDKLERAWGSKQTLEFLSTMGKPLLDDKGRGLGSEGAGKFSQQYTKEEAEQRWAVLGKDRDFMAKLARNDPGAVEQRDTLTAARRGQSLDEYRQEIAGAREVFNPRSARTEAPARRV